MRERERERGIFIRQWCYYQDRQLGAVPMPWPFHALWEKSGKRGEPRGEGGVPSAWRNGRSFLTTTRQAEWGGEEQRELGRLLGFVLKTWAISQ